MNNNAWSPFSKNSHREAKNIVNLDDLAEVTHSRFVGFANDPRAQPAPQDLNHPRVRQRQALGFLGLDLVPVI